MTFSTEALASELDPRTAAAARADRRAWLAAAALTALALAVAVGGARPRAGAADAPGSAAPLVAPAPAPAPTASPVVGEPSLVGLADGPRPVAYLIVGGLSARLQPGQALAGWTFEAIDGDAARFRRADGARVRLPRRAWSDPAAPPRGAARPTLAAAPASAVALAAVEASAPQPPPAPAAAVSAAAPNIPLPSAVLAAAEAAPPRRAEPPPPAPPRYWVGPPGSAPPGYIPMPTSLLPPPPSRYQGG